MKPEAVRSVRNREEREKHSDAKATRVVKILDMLGEEVLVTRELDGR